MQIAGFLGLKRSLLVDAGGIPPSRVASGANRHDSYLLRATQAAIRHQRTKRWAPEPMAGQNARPERRAASFK